MHGELDPLNSVPTSQRAHYNHFKKTNRLMLVREIITVYCKNHKKKNTFCEQNAKLFNAKASGTYRNHCALKG
jgi:hypothetical protein